MPEVLMDHRFIDENAVAERYLKHTLRPYEHAEFQAHLVDCQECHDRVLLAEMFLHSTTSPDAPDARDALPNQDSLASAPLRVRIVARLDPWVLLALIVITSLLLLAIPTAVFYWELSQLNISDVGLPVRR